MKSIALILIFFAFQQTGRTEDQIAKKFWGHWELIAQMNSEGVRMDAKQKHFLEISGQGLRRYDEAGSDGPMFPAPVFISESGKFWLQDPASKRKVFLGQVLLNKEELKLSQLGGGFHLIYHKVKVIKSSEH